MSQRRSGGLESAAIRRALSQRRSGGVISRERRAWGCGNPGTKATRRRAWESHRRRRISPAIGGHECSQPEDSQHSRRSRRTPTPSCSGLWREDEWRLPCHGTDKQEQIKTFQKTNKRKRGEWASHTVRSGLLSRCTHEGGTRTRRRGHKLK